MGKRLKGAVEEIEGAIKEVAGKVTGNERTKREGAAEERAGRRESAHEGGKAEIRDAMTK